MNIKHIAERLAGKHLTSCGGTPCDCGAAPASPAAPGNSTPPLILFPPEPRATLQHETLGPLFDRLTLQFYAAKHAEALAQLLDAAYMIDVTPRESPAHVPASESGPTALGGDRNA